MEMMVVVMVLVLALKHYKAGTVAQLSLVLQQLQQVNCPVVARWWGGVRWGVDWLRNMVDVCGGGMIGETGLTQA